MENLTPKKPLMVAATVALVLASFILMMYDLEACLHIVFAILALTSSGLVNGKAIGTILTFILGAAGLTFIAFSTDYNMRHAGERRSFKLLAISLAIQSVVAVIGLVIL